jgi:prepilin peptidase CpaA
LELRLVLWILLGVALVISAVTDLLQRQILDVVTLSTLGLALAIRTIKEGVGDLERGLVSGLISAAAACVLFVVLALRKKMGWGDVKLMAAVGAAFGYPTVMAAMVFVSLAGALQGIVSLMWAGEGLATARTIGERWLSTLRRKPAGEAMQLRKIPYGVAIALGSFWAMWWEGSTGIAN